MHFKYYNYISATFRVEIVGYDGSLKDGDELQLTCKMVYTGDEIVSFSWLFTSGTDTSVQIGENEKYTKNSVSKSDSGEYKCIASTETAKAEDTVAVKVLPVEKGGNKAPQTDGNEFLWPIVGGAAGAGVLLLAGVGYFVCRKKKGPKKQSSFG